MTTSTLPDIDNRLLAAVQERIPLAPRPYAEIAGALGVAESTVMERISALRSGPRGVIRQISAIFDSASLGYQSTLIAAKVPENQLSAAAATISAHPGVSHNYRRDHEYNLWYTLAVPPDSRIGLETTSQLLHKLSSAVVTRLMPTLKMYKIGVKLNLAEGTQTQSASTNAPAASHSADHPSTPITPREKQLIRVLQRDLPATERPFDAWAAEIGVSVEELLAAAAQFQARKLMRRYSAVLRHRELGFDANAMGVWIVPPDQHDRFGAIAAGFPQVSHCYLRPSYPDWPYSLYTMIHAREKSQGASTLKSISTATGITQYAALYSTLEYKKVRIRYFEDDIPAWESKYA
jgi:DNA-binding Lrp family transcriptional regulator